MLFSDAPLRVSPQRIDALLRERRDVALDYEGIGLDGLAIACLVTADRGLLELLAPREEALHDDRPALGVRGALREAVRGGGADERLAVGLRTFALWRRDPMAWVDVPPADVPPVSAIVRDRFRSWQHLFGGAQRVVAARGATGIPFDREQPIETPPEEADALLDALAGLPDWDYLRDLVLAFAARLEGEGQRAAAEQYLRRAVAKDEGSAAIRYALASVVERKGDKADALVLYRTVLAFEPRHQGALAKVLELDASVTRPR
jgi:tetratricopeptide (TPR) repeat protein